MANNINMAKIASFTTYTKVANSGMCKIRILDHSTFTIHEDFSFVLPLSLDVNLSCHKVKMLRYELDRHESLEPDS